METTYTWPYGRQEISFTLPDERVKNCLTMAQMQPLADPIRAIREALLHPIDSAPLPELIDAGDKVAIIVNDTTRIAHTDIFLPVIVEMLNERGVADEDITILFALGMHRPMTDEEMISQITEDLFRRLRTVNAQARHDADYIKIGTTSYGTPIAFHKDALAADKLILTGSVVHHFFAGFGGGRKALFPGVAHRETIRHNHSLMLDPHAVIGEIKTNPIYLDQVEGCEMHRPTFLLNTVLNEKKEFIGVFAGDYITAHEKACELVDRMNGVEIPREYPIVIVTCGGYPKDINIYQSQKTMDNAVCAVQEGGVVILLAACPEGSGNSEFDGKNRSVRARRFSNRPSQSVRGHAFDEKSRFLFAFRNARRRGPRRPFHAGAFGRRSADAGGTKTRSERGHLPHAARQLHGAAACEKGVRRNHGVFKSRYRRYRHHEKTASLRQ